MKIMGLPLDFWQMIVGLVGVGALIGAIVYLIRRHDKALDRLSNQLEKVNEQSEKRAKEAEERSERRVKEAEERGTNLLQSLESTLKSAIEGLRTQIAEGFSAINQRFADAEVRERELAGRLNKALGGFEAFAGVIERSLTLSPTSSKSYRRQDPDETRRDSVEEFEDGRRTGGTSSSGTPQSHRSETRP